MTTATVAMTARTAASTEARISVEELIVLAAAAPFPTRAAAWALKRDTTGNKTFTRFYPL